ncbi:MAG: 50S ribosomal protein L35 [Armatimonadota bacterium]|nr:50S ribosomal protein L35 [Armatimonadota bacterium]
MPKMRTRKTAAKRFEATASGKILKRRTGKGHLMLKKSPSRKRRLDIKSQATSGEKRQIRRMVPYL